MENDKIKKNSILNSVTGRGVLQVMRKGVRKIPGDSGFPVGEAQVQSPRDSIWLAGGRGRNQEFFMGPED